MHNVEQILSRGERIELLVDKTDALSGQVRSKKPNSGLLCSSTQFQCTGTCVPQRRARCPAAAVLAKPAHPRALHLRWSGELLLALFDMGRCGLCAVSSAPLSDTHAALQFILYLLIAQFCGLALNHCSKKKA